jgi:hypothetical protein
VLSFSSDPYKISDMIGLDKVKDFLQSLHFNGVFILLVHANKPDIISDIIIKAKGEDLDFDEIGSILTFSENLDEIKNLLLKAGVSKEDINEVIESDDRIKTDPIP